MFLGVLDTNVNGDIHCLALRIIHWQNNVRQRDIVERLRDPKYDCAEEAAEEIEKLRERLEKAHSFISRADWMLFFEEEHAAATALKETGDE